jgi:DNA-binding NarL/FixJ family response regulator
LYCLECYSENPDNSPFCEICGCPFEIADEHEEEILKYRYRIITPLSREDTVFLAYDINLNRPCVVKIIADLQDLSFEEKKITEQSFKRDASLLANLRHPDLPCIVDYFLEDDVFYLVMDYIRGKNLALILKDTPGKMLPEQKVIQWSIQICRIMEYLYNYRSSVLYGNVKLNKFIVRNSDKCLILVDFCTLFMRNLIGGNLNKHDVRHDIYDTGVIMYQLLTGEFPDEPLRFISIKEFLPEISSEIDYIVMKCLESNLKNRFSDFNILKQSLLNLHTLKFGTGHKYKTSTVITKDKHADDNREFQNKYIKIFIVDDDLDISHSFESMVSFFKDMKVIGIAHNGLDAVKQLISMEEKPDVILMDLRMPEMDGLEATEKIMDMLPFVKIIILTAYLREQEFLECFNVGAKGYILKDATLWEELEKAIRKAFEGGTPISPEASPFLIKALAFQNKDVHKRFIDRSFSVTRQDSDKDKSLLNQICPFCRNLNKDKAKYCTECGINIIKFLTEGKLETAYDKDLIEKEEEKISENRRSCRDRAEEE